jgi:hypothetical protein
MAFPGSGGVLVSDAPGNVRLFPADKDGQSADWFPPAQNYGGFANAADLVQVNGNIYMSQNPYGQVLQINDDGTFNQVIASGIPGAAGMAVNPANGHLFVSASSVGKIMDVDPVAQTSTLFVNGVYVDGLTMSADGSTLYAADVPDNRVIGYDTSTGSVVFNSGVLPGGLDGIAEGTGLLAGNVYVNCNNGTVVEVNIADPTQHTVIAGNGSRGDFVTVDPYDGSVFFTQVDRIVRLTFPTGGRTPKPGPASGFGESQLAATLASAKFSLGQSLEPALPPEMPAPATGSLAQEQNVLTNSDVGPLSSWQQHVLDPMNGGVHPKGSHRTDLQIWDNFPLNSAGSPIE